MYESNDEKVDMFLMYGNTYVVKMLGSLRICIYRDIQIADIFSFFIYLRFLENELVLIV
jgi:hypothetical protein